MRLWQDARVVGRRSVLVVLATGVLAAGAAAAAFRPVTHGTITPNVGAAGITLGMTRTQVTAKLGRPFYANSHGYMQYGNKDLTVLFDVYLDVFSKPQRVRLIGIYGSGFCIANGGPCLTQKGGQGKLRARYGSALKTVKLEDGEQVVWLKGKYRGCAAYTDFGEAGRPRSAQVGMVFVGFQSGRSC
jgi:hypothetical protein